MNGHTLDWHPAADALRAYAEGTAARVQADSTEAHLLRCDRCRDGLATLASSGRGLRADPVWSAIADRIDRPSPSARTGPWWLKVTFGSPLLAIATMALAGALLVVPLLVAVVEPSAGAAVLLALAPLAPVAGALLAYRPEIDPAGAMTAATPLATAALVLTRAAVVAAAAIAAALVAALALPTQPALLVGWLLPGLALSLVVLAAGTTTDPTRLAGGLALAWSTAIAVASARLRHVALEEMLHQLFVNQRSTQLACLVIATVAAAALVARRDHVAWSPR